MNKAKKRFTYLLLAAVTLMLGLCSRRYGEYLPTFVATYAGDVLYATLVFFLLRFVMITRSLRTIAAVTILFCLLIETSQLYQATWMQTIRNTAPFGLILGYGFLWSDVACYAVGTLVGFSISLFIERNLFRA